MSKFLKAMAKHNQSKVQPEKLKEYVDGVSTVESLYPQKLSNVTMIIILLSILGVASIAFVIYRIASVSAGISMTQEQVSDIKTSIQDQKQEIKNLTEKVNKLGGLNSRYQSLEDKISKDSDELNNKFAQFSENVDSKLQTSSVNTSHLRTTIIELKNSYQKIEQELTEFKTKQNESK